MNDNDSTGVVMANCPALDPLLLERIAILEQMVKWASEGSCMLCGQYRTFGCESCKRIAADNDSQAFTVWHQRVKILEELK